MRIGILKEKEEKRVAVTPGVAQKIIDLGFDVCLEKNAGKAAGFNDADYDNCMILKRNEILESSDLVIAINPPEQKELEMRPKNSYIIAEFKPFFDDKITGLLNSLGLKAFSMDMIPRTTLAQTMDVLSSMASIAGYKAVLLAASSLPRYFPRMITAAGSIRPAKLLVLGAGVAGLQAIATARRLGAMVEAFDTRSAVKEEVESLGARFVEVEGAVEDTGAGGYAIQQSEEFLNRQREEVQKRSIQADVIITTAQVRGRKAPILIPKETVERMKPGAIIVDLAASTGGNCELTENGKTISVSGVTIVGDSNLADSMAQDASTLYSNNLFNFYKLLAKDGKLEPDLENEIIKGALITNKN
jgi:NAD(P) transhydrogenase subunit alpha